MGRARDRQTRNATVKTLTAGGWFEKLVEVMAQLRGPGGCPWDREQNHASLRTYLIEEAYEVLDAMGGADQHFAEELGDLLLQVVFHAEIARGEKRFAIADVIRSVHDKLIRRHPHVFGDMRVKDAAEVLRNWEQIKAGERSAQSSERANTDGGSLSKASALDGVPRGLPGTMEGLQMTRKASRIGFDWENADGVFAKIEEELGELREAVGQSSAEAREEELGDLLFATVNLARMLKIDPEIALKKSNAKFARRFREMERAAAGKGEELRALPRDAMEALWNEAKRAERHPNAHGAELAGE